MLTAGPFTLIFKPADAVINLNIGTVASANRLDPNQTVSSLLAIHFALFDTSLDSIIKRIVI